MAKGKKTGGRDFVKGDSRINRRGRPREYQYMYEIRRDFIGREDTKKYEAAVRRLWEKGDSSGEASMAYLDIMDIVIGRLSKQVDQIIKQRRQKRRF